MRSCPFATCGCPEPPSEGWQLVPKEPTEEMVRKALSSTAVWHDIKGSQLNVNMEKMRIRWRAMLTVAPSPDK